MIKKSKLIECGDCKKDISRNAVTCPHCGAKNKKKPDSAIVMLAKIFLCLIFVSWMLNMCDSPQDVASGPSDTYRAVATDPVNVTPVWHYSFDEDQMNGKKTFWANIESANKINFDFPYAGEQRGRLTLRTHPRYGKDVILSISKGQFLCSYDGCSVLVRFDEGQPVRFSASEPADNDTTTLFIRGYSNFMAHMMKAKRVRIEAVFYQEGNQVFDFNVGGFDADKYLRKKAQ